MEETGKALNLNSAPTVSVYITLTGRKLKNCKKNATIGICMLLF